MMHKAGLFSLSIMLITALVCGPVSATDIDYAIVGPYALLDNTTITSSGSLSGGIVNVSGAVVVQNNGTITSGLDISAHSHLYIENRGTYNAPATLGDGATITQIINTAADITELTGVGVDYGVLIDDIAEILSWDDIRAKTVNATEYVLSSANIRMNEITAFDKHVVVNGIVFVYTDVVPESDVLLFSNVSGSGTVRIGPESSNSNPLYLAEAYNSGGMIFMRPVRLTDYGHILNNDAGNFLNLLREKSPNDKLLRILDDAENMNDLNRIMKRSVRLHPIKLMQSLKTMYSHKILEIMHIDNVYDIGIMPTFVFSNDLRLMGIEPNANIKIDDDLQINLSLNLSKLNYSDDINEYGGISVGVGADVLYGFSENNFMRVYGGINWTLFDTGLVFDGSGKTENPNGLSGYVAAELGHRIMFGDNLYVLPFVMANGDYAQIINSVESGVYAGVGSDVGVGFEFDGLRYDYAARGIVRSDGGMGAELSMSVWSIVDDIGADARFGAFYDNEFGLSYRISLNAKVGF